MIGEMDIMVSLKEELFSLRKTCFLKRAYFSFKGLIANFAGYFYRFQVYNALMDSKLTLEKIKSSLRKPFYQLVTNYRIWTGFITALKVTNERFDVQVDVHVVFEASLSKGLTANFAREFLMNWIKMRLFLVFAEF